MKILGVEAHPDDVDLLCSGTLARLATLGHEVAILAVTAGELGTMGTSREESISNRLKEARDSAAVIGAEFYYAGIPDKHVFFNEENRNRIAELFRIIGPDIVFAPSPKDYILDHEFSSLLARDAATAMSARLFETDQVSPAPIVDKFPWLYYCDPIGRIDIFGNPVLASTYVDITETIESKLNMFSCYISQVEFLKHRHRIDYLPVIRQWAVDAGKVAGVEMAEGFRQHVAPPFRKDNILVELLGAKIVKNNISD